MIVFRGIQTLTRPLSESVVTIGNFDGVHLGHAEIIRQTVEKAKQRGCTSIAFTFRPHPQIALRPETAPDLLSTYDEKIESMGQLGLDVIIEEPFNPEFSKLTPEDFFSEILIKKLRAKVIVVGYDFAFGNKRQGHLESLESLCGKDGVELIVVPPRKVGDEAISSSRIRDALKRGDVDSASRLLGRPFSYQGVVVQGESRGRKIGFPTANLKIANKITLPFGVYATRSFCEGKLYLSVTNVGIRPTFAGDQKESPVVVETHIFDQSPDLYGKTLEVHFVKHLREERKFQGIDGLKTQISMDIQNARKVLTT